MKKNNLLLIALLLTCFYGYNEIFVPAFAQDQNIFQLNTSRNITVSAAEELLNQGNIDGAMDIYNKILEKDPNSIPARIGRANLFSDQYKIKAAQREFNRVLQQDPTNSAAHNGLGLTYLRITTSSNMDIRENIGELYRQAAEEFKQAIQYNPSNDEAHANLGVIYQLQGRTEEAEAQYRESLAINPNNSTANYKMGTIYKERGDIDTAIDCYQKALATDSKNSSAHYYLGEALIAKGQYSKAIESLQTSLYLNPISAPVHEKLGEAYKHQGNETAAIEEFKKAIAIKPEDTLAYLLLSSVYEDRGDEELGIAELKSALKNNPNFTEANLKIANMSLKTNKIDQAIEYYQKTLLDDPENPEAEKGLSKAYFRKVQNDVATGTVTAPAKLIEAEKYVNNAIENNPEDLELHFAKFKLEKLTNKPEPTQEELQIQASSNPQNVPQTLDKGYAQFKLHDYQNAQQTFIHALNNTAKKEDKLLVAETIAEYKDFTVAENAFKTVLMEDPENIEAKRGLEKIRINRQNANSYYNLGWDLSKKGQRKSAIDQFNKAQSADPSLAKAYYWAAETYKKDNQLKSAYENYKIFLALINNSQSEIKDKELLKQVKNAQSLVKKLAGKQNKK